MKKIMIGILVLSFFLSGCGASATVSSETEAQEVISTPVEVYKAVPSSIKNTFVYAGQLEAKDTIAVLPKMQGKVKETYYEVGDAVSEGQTLFALDEKDIQDQIRTLQAQLNQASQGVASAQNSLNSVTGGQYESSLLQQQTAMENYQKQMDGALITIENAKVSLENAKLNLDNMNDKYNNIKLLYDSGTVSKNEHDNAKTAYEQSLFAYEQANNALTQAQLGYDQAKFALEQAQQSYNLTTGKITEDNKRSASIGVSSAQASANVIATQLQIARETLNDKVVKAPISGVVSVKNAKAGEYVSMQTPAYTIVNVTNLKVSVRVSELIINKLKVGDEIDLYVNSISDKPFTAKIKTISPAADQTNTYPVTLEIGNNDGLFKPGMFAEVHFVSEAKDNTIVLPINTVLEDNEGLYVFVNESGKAKRVAVTTGINNGKDIEILSGLNLNDEVVIKGQTYISNGDPINDVGQSAKEGVSPTLPSVSKEE